MRPRIILEGAGMNPELPRCVLCNQQKYVFSDSKLCKECDLTQSMGAEREHFHHESYCRKCKTLFEDILKIEKERDEARLAFKILGDKYDQLIKEIKAKSK